MKTIILGLTVCVTACGGHVATVTEKSAAERLSVGQAMAVVTGSELPASDSDQSGMTVENSVTAAPSPQFNFASENVSKAQYDLQMGGTRSFKAPPSSGDTYIVPVSVPRDIPEPEVTFGRTDSSTFVSSDYKTNGFIDMNTSFTEVQPDDKFDGLATDSHGIWRTRLSSEALGAGNKVHAEFAQSSFDPHTSEGFGASENRLFKVGVSDSAWGFELGLDYQSVGKDFDNSGSTAGGHKKKDNNPQNKILKGQQGTEFWVSRQFGDFNVKMLALTYQDNNDEDSGVPRFATNKVGGSLNYMISSWPSMGIMLDYRNGVRESIDGAAGKQYGEINVENIASSLYYADDIISGTLYVENATGEGTTDITNYQTYWLGGSYYPVSNFSLNPSVSFVKQLYPAHDVTTDSYAASMSVSYKPHDRSRFNFTGYSEYSTEKNRDWAMDSEYVYNSIGIDWNAKEKNYFIKKWSMEVFHDQYTDNLYSGNNVGGVGLMLKLRSTILPFRPSSRNYHQ